ncbi:MAG TPA: hypothetical protein VHG51_11810 [Longimicrobiaceae bacterium]|nr:hypothetical protein [Longimicrobiaceae bacterium]
MSRSYHVTRAGIERALRRRWPSRERRRAAIGRLLREHRRKREVKRAVGRGRRKVSLGFVPAPAEAVAVRVVETGVYVHHAATLEDVREVLRRLPPGVTDGLAAVELRLGIQVQHDERPPEGDGPDPFTGRLGAERYPGVWAGRVLGRYLPAHGRIELFAHVYDPAIPDRALWEALLRYGTLRTLAHEAAHHHDAVHRVGRGRWTARPGERAERYARDREEAWTEACVLPYLRERHPREARLIDALRERLRAMGATEREG